MFLFRPPYGVTTPALAKATKITKVTSVGWTLRSMDTVTRSPEKLVHKIKHSVSAGDIVLLHDTATVSSVALPEIIRLIHEKGLKIVRVDALLKVHPYA